VRKGTYRISFGRYDEKTTFTVVPVYDRKNIAKAMAYYEKKFDNYKQKLLSEIAKEKKINEAKKLKAKNEINALLEKYSKEDDAQEKLETQQEINRLKYDTMIRAQRKSQVQMFNSLEDERLADRINNAIYRSFSIRQFGVYNCDCPAILPMGADVVASFIDSTGHPLNLKQVSLIELTKKIMFTIYPYNFNHFKFNPSDENMICAVTDNYKFVYFTTKDFKKVKRSGDYTFKMRTSEAEIESSEDIDDILALN
jgi:actin-related protein